jgi:chemosensory pili system protein ChpA (sensor histidine kinase/response regulator)
VKFIIRLPFTLAISQSLLVRVGESEIYALPLPTVEGVVRLPVSEIQAHLSNDAPSFEYGGQMYKVQHLGAFIDAGPSVLPESGEVSLVLIKAGEHSTALVTDELLGNREIGEVRGPQVSSIAAFPALPFLAMVVWSSFWIWVHWYVPNGVNVPPAIWPRAVKTAASSRWW